MIMTASAYVFVAAIAAMQPAQGAQLPIYVIDHKASLLAPQPTPSADEAASYGLRIVEQLVKNDKNRAQALGFLSSDDATAANMILGRAIPIMRINVERLKVYQPSSDLASLLETTDEFLYPITVGGTIRSSLIVKKLRSGQWKAVSSGAGGIPLAVEKVKTGDASFSPLVVQLYELWFIGAPSGQEVTLRPFNSDSLTGISIDKEDNSRDVLMRLKDYVNRLEDSPQKAKGYKKRALSRGPY